MKIRLPCALAALLLACPSQAAETPAAAMEPSGLDERLLLPDVALTDRHGGTQGLVSRYEDAGLVLYGFIYTNCTESCGLTISVMGLVDMDLQTTGAPDLRLVSVSVDPWRDTPAVLDEVAEMVQASPGWDWVVATPQATPLLLSAFGLEPGPPEKHGALYVLGDLRRGMFWRLPGDAQPHELIAMARRYGAAHPP